jgi:hypothetical protein
VALALADVRPVRERGCRGLAREDFTRQSSDKGGAEVDPLLEEMVR